MLYCGIALDIMSAAILTATLLQLDTVPNTSYELSSQFPQTGNK